MERSDLIDKLTDLAQMDYDAVTVYGKALEHVTDETVKRNFEQFQAEHRNHFERLSRHIQDMGGEAPEAKVDMMGRLGDWMASFRSRSTEGALHALKTAEDYHNKHYAEAMDWDVGEATLKKDLTSFYGDEQRHLQFVDTHLREMASARR